MLSFNIEINGETHELTMEQAKALYEELNNLFATIPPKPLYGGNGAVGQRASNLTKPFSTLQ